MELFQFAQKNLATLGIIPNQQYPFNGKNVMAFICFWTDNILNIIYLFAKANSFDDYTNSVFITTCTSGVSVCFTIIALNAKNLFKLVDTAGKIYNFGE